VERTLGLLIHYGFCAPSINSYQQGVDDLGFAYRAENYTINIPRGRLLHRNYYIRPELRPKSGFAPPYKQKPIDDRLMIDDAQISQPVARVLVILSLNVTE
jgi:hypothetical protein